MGLGCTHSRHVKSGLAKSGWVVDTGRSCLGMSSPFPFLQNVIEPASFLSWHRGELCSETSFFDGSFP